MTHERSHADQLLSCDICTKVKQSKLDLKVTTASDTAESSSRSVNADAGDLPGEDQGNNYF